MRGLAHHLLSLVVIAVVAVGSVGLRTAHVAGTHGCSLSSCAGRASERAAPGTRAAVGCSHAKAGTVARPHVGTHTGARAGTHTETYIEAHAVHTDAPSAPAHPETCQTCQQIDTFAGGALLPVSAPAFTALVAPLGGAAPHSRPAPRPLRVTGARPPPQC